MPSFLDRVAKNTPATKPAAAAPVAEKKPNPLLGGKPNPLLGKKPEVKPEETKVSEPAEPKKANPLLAPKKPEVKAPVEGTRQNPFVKKDGPVEEIKVDKDPIAEAGAQKAVEEVQEEISNAAVEEVKTAEPIKTEEVNNATPAATSVEAPITEASKTASTSKRRGSSSRKATASSAPDKAEDPVDIPEDSIVIPRTTFNYADAIAKIKSGFEDKNWADFKEEIEEEMAGIVIEADMNPATLKQTSAALNALRSKIESEYNFNKTQYEMLTSEKPEGLILRIRSIAYSDNDKNDMDRKKAGILACMNYKAEGGIVNLYEILDETRERYNFLQSIMNSIQFKSSSLITMNGALKIEERLTPIS